MARLRRYDSRDTTMIAGARPLSLEGDPARPAVLLLHGFTGYPGELRFVAEELNGAGYTVAVPRYPGHGTNSGDFRSTSWRDWWRRALDVYLELKTRHDRVVVAGLSMGGLIATLLAARYPVAGATLLAPAFLVSNRLVSLTPVLRFIVPPVKAQTSEVYDDPERRHMADEYWNWRWPHQTASLYYLIRRARKALPAVACPSLLIASRTDRTVPVAVAPFVERRIGSSDHRTVILDESAHVITDGQERSRVAAEMRAWLREVEAAGGGV
ncbi:MAG: alpha/beta fold hydrolase [Spirochaetales bacterium]|nr:alpha/beta fold hydrolase [Spirochaetales bacterium]